MSISNNQGDPPALPGRQQKFDSSGSQARGSTDETSNAGPQSTLTKFRRWTVVRVHERIDERRKDTTRG
jgi:hypothetical protein